MPHELLLVPAVTRTLGVVIHVDERGVIDAERSMYVKVLKEPAAGEAACCK